MSDCFSENHRRRDTSEHQQFHSIAREQWHEHSREHAHCRKHPSTASEHLPELSIVSDSAADGEHNVEHAVATGGAVDNSKPGSESVGDLTQRSEELLPVHANGSYPDVSDWEGLHRSNVEKAASAAQAGSNLEFFGDSITEAMGYSPSAMQPFKDSFGVDQPTALGLGGDGSAQLLYRLNHGEMQGKPKTAVIMIGTNDLGSLSASQIAENTANSIKSIQERSPNTRVVLMGILPRTDSGDPGNRMVDEANQALSQLATSGGAVQFVNLRNSFVDQSGNQRSELYQADKLHLSAAGYQAWADGLKSALQNTEADSFPGVWSGTSPANGNVGDYTTVTQPEGSGNGGDYTPMTPSEASDQSSGAFTYKPLNGGSSDGQLTLDTAGIRGVNLSGAEWGKNSSQDSHFWPTAQELDYYKSKGLNTVRLAISWEQFQPTLNGPLDASEMARLDSFLHEADARGMKVLLNLANFDRYTLNHGPNGQGIDHEAQGTVVGSPGLPISAMQDFWSKMVRHVDADASASRAIAGWDLTNEPFNTNGLWPETATAVDQAIRATGDNHTVVVEGDQWARNFSGLEGLAKLDKNVAFEAHSYWDDGSGAYSNPNPPDNVNVGVDNIRPFVEWLKQNDARGFVGEWGVPTDNPAWAPAVTNFIHYLNQNGMGNMVWAGGPGWQSDYTLSVEPVNGQDRAIMSTIVQANNS
ncbi:MAG: cellulase family glycosylhydrolase [Cyanobacteria bacterium SZAS LIN-5]|nr:cellulase family glycosylhydrolase [Cyanobacteria bacterium SZAS LIN-5]